jgi:hypothetical protein
MRRQIASALRWLASRFDGPYVYTVRVNTSGNTVDPHEIAKLVQEKLADISAFVADDRGWTP